MTPRELNTVCGESNEMNGEKKIVFGFTSEKKNCLLLIRSEKIVRLSLESKKKVLSQRKNHSPPHISNGPPLTNVMKLSPSDH